MNHVEAELSTAETSSRCTGEIHSQPSRVSGVRRSLRMRIRTTLFSMMPLQEARFQSIPTSQTSRRSILCLP